MIVPIAILFVGWISGLGQPESIVINFKNEQECVKYDAKHPVINSSGFILGWKNFSQSKNDLEAVLQLQCNRKIFEIVKVLGSDTLGREDEDLIGMVEPEELIEVVETIDYLGYHKEMLNKMMRRLATAMLCTGELYKKVIDRMNRIREDETDGVEERLCLIILLNRCVERYELKVDVNGDVATIRRKSSDNEDNESVEWERITKIKIVPDALTTPVKERRHTDASCRLGLFLWMIKGGTCISGLDLSGCIISDISLMQISHMKYLKSLQLVNCPLCSSEKKELNKRIKSMMMLEGRLGTIDSESSSLKDESDISTNPQDLLQNIVATAPGQDCSAGQIKEDLVEAENLLLNIKDFSNLEALDLRGGILDEKLEEMLDKMVNLKELNIEGCGLNGKGRLNFIEKMKELKDLHIGHNTLSNDDLDRIFSHKSIEILDMAKCYVDPEYVYKGSNFMSSVKVFNGSQVFWNDEQLKLILSRCGMQVLKLEGCNLELGVLSALEGGETVEELNVGDNNMLGDEDFINIVEKCKNLKRLSVKNCRIIFGGKVGVACLSQLEELDIGGNKLGLQLCNYIFQHDTLRKLNVAECGLTEYCLIGLAKLERLVELVIDGNEVGHRDLGAIFGLKELTVLSMANCGIYRDIHLCGIEGLGETLLELDVSGNNLVQEHIENIAGLSRLEVLKMERCGDLRGVLIPIKNLVNLRKLMVGNSLIKKVDFSVIAELTKLEVLDVNNSIIVKDTLEKIEGLKDCLLELNVKGCHLSIADTRRVLNLRKLVKLSMTIVYTGENILVNLRHFKSLKVLRINNFGMSLGRPSLAAVFALSNLESLEMESCTLDKRLIDGLYKFPHLKELIIQDVGNFIIGRSSPYGCFLDLARLPLNLRKVRITGSINLTFDGVEEMGTQVPLRYLEELSIKHNSRLTGRNWALLTGLPRLRKLSIDNCRLVEFPFHAIEQSCTLESLSFEGTNLRSIVTSPVKFPKQLRSLVFLVCCLNNAIIGGVQNLTYLEELIVVGSAINDPINQIMKLPNLRTFHAGDVRMKYTEDEQFKEIKGFKKIYLGKCDIYMNGSVINRESEHFNEIMAKMREEITLNNWKGLEELKVGGVDIYNPFLEVVGERLAFLKNLSLTSSDTATTINMAFDSCAMLRETSINLSPPARLSAEIPVELVKKNILLNTLKIHVVMLSVQFAQALSRCRQLQKIVLYAEDMEDGFLDQLFNAELLNRGSLKSFVVVSTTGNSLKRYLRKNRGIIDNARAHGIIIFFK